MLKGLAACVCAVVLGACTSSVDLHAPSPSPTNLADTPAANLRVHLDLLLVEHTTALGKMTVAAAAGRKDEFRAYAGVLAANGTDLTALMKSALGPTTGDQVGEAWAAGNNFAVDYMVAAVTHDQAKADAAMQSLSNDYVTQLSSALLPALPPQSDDVPKLATQDVMAFKIMVDDTVAGSYQKAFSDLAASLVGTAGFADGLAGKIAQQFPDRFPGDPFHKAAATRAGLAVHLAMQASLYTMLTQAIVAGAQGEQSGATQAVTLNNASLATVSGAWTQALAPITSYAKNGDAPSHSGLVSLGAPDLSASFEALLQVVDDQRAKAYDKLGPDDRAAAATFAAVADR